MTDQATLGLGATEQQNAPEPFSLAQNQGATSSPSEPDLSGLPADLVAEYNKTYGGNMDDDYSRALEQREQQKMLDEIEQYAQSQGLPPQAPQPDENENETIWQALQRAGSKYWGQTEQIATGQTKAGRPKEPDAVFSRIALDVGADVAKGLTTEGDKIIIGGPMRATQAALDLGDELAVWLNNNVADWRIGDRSKPMQVGDHGIQLPNIGGVMDDAETVTGGVGQAITQFLTGFAALPAAGAARGAITAKAAATDFVFFDGQEENLANLVQQLGGEGNAVIDYLANDEKTPELQGRLKSAVANIIPDAMFEGLVRGLDVMKAVRKAKQLNGTDTFEEAVQKTHTFEDPTAGVKEDTGANIERLLNGSRNQDVLKINQKLKHVDIEVPEDVLARGLDEGAHNAPPPLPGNARMYGVIRRDMGRDESIRGGVYDFYDTIGAAKSKIKEGAEKGEELRLVHTDVPVENVPGKKVEGGKFRVRVTDKPFKKPLGSEPPPLPELGEATPQINWSKFETQNDVLVSLSRMAEAFSDDITKAQRGVQSNEATRQAAGDENAWKLLSGKRNPKSPIALTAHEQFALRELWASSGQKLTELAKIARDGGNENMFAFRKMLAIHNTIQQTVMGVRTETARALQQWNMPVGTSADKMRQIEYAVSNQEGTTKGLAKRIATLADTETPLKLEKFLRPTAGQRTAAVIKEVFLNSILSGPKTHIVNGLSNLAVVQYEILQRRLASRAGDMIDPADGARLKEATYMMHGQVEAMKDMFKYTAHRLRVAAKTASDIQQIGVERNTTPGTLLKYKPSKGQFDEVLARQQAAIEALKDPIVRVGMDKMETQGRTRAVSSEYMDINTDSNAGAAVDFLGSIINLPGTMLGGADDFFKTINYRAELHASAFRRAMLEADEGLLKKDDIKSRIADLIDEPPEDLRLGGEEAAAINTFTSQPNKVAKSLNNLRHMIDEFSVGNTGIPMGTIILPFVNTPANILAYTFDRTPLAVIGRKFKEDVASGGTRRSMALARVGLGSAVMMSTYSLALNGHLTGGGPKDPGKRRTLRRNGWQPYSIRIKTGEDMHGNALYRYYAYNRLDPIGLLLGMSADLAEFALNTDGQQDPGFTEAGSTLALNVAKNIVNKTYLSSLSKLITAIEDPERYGESYFTRLGTAIVPTFVKEIARSQDPVARHTWDMISSLKNALPGEREDLPARLDFWGNEIKYVSDLGAAYDMISPIYSDSNKRAHAVDRELMRIGYAPYHKRSIRVDNNKIVSLKNLPHAYTRLIKLTSATKAMDLVYQNMPELMARRGGRERIRKLEKFGNRTLRETMNDIMFGKATGALQELAFDYAMGDAQERMELLRDHVISQYKFVAKLQTRREFPRIDEIAAAIPERKGNSNPMYDF